MEEYLDFLAPQPQEEESGTDLENILSSIMAAAGGSVVINIINMDSDSGSENSENMTLPDESDQLNYLFGNSVPLPTANPGP